jgi:hypothetical protein
MEKPARHRAVAHTMPFFPQKAKKPRNFCAMVENQYEF